MNGDIKYVCIFAPHIQKSGALWHDQHTLFQYTNFDNLDITFK